LICFHLSFTEKIQKEFVKMEGNFYSPALADFHINNMQEFDTNKIIDSIINYLQI